MAKGRMSRMRVLPQHRLHPAGRKKGRHRAMAATGVAAAAAPDRPAPPARSASWPARPRQPVGRDDAAGQRREHGEAHGQRRAQQRDLRRHQPGERDTGIHPARPEKPGPKLRRSQHHQERHRRNSRPRGVLPFASRIKPDEQQQRQAQIKPLLLLPAIEMRRNRPELPAEQINRRGDDHIQQIAGEIIRPS